MSNNSNNGVIRNPDGTFAPGSKPLKPFEPMNTLTSKYKPEYADAMVQWFESQVAESPRYPTFERFAHSIGVLHATLRYWKEHPETYRGFDNAYTRCKEIQMSVLTENTLGKVYDPSFAKFVATNTLGMVDQSALTVQGNEEKPVSVSIRIVE